MSHIEIAAPPDPAIEALREQVRLLDAELLDLARRAAIATACRERLVDIVAMLSRKPRVRKPRAEAAEVPATTAPAGWGAVDTSSDAAGMTLADEPSF